MWRALTLTLILLIGPTGTGRAESTPLYQAVESEGTPNYLLHLPVDYEATDQHYPLLFFLHGIAQKGNGSATALEKVAEDGPFRTMRDGLWDSTLPFIVVGPQSGGLLPWWRGAEVRKVLEHVRKTYRIDPRRIYLTGISMGGRSIWWLAKNFAGDFAAMIPVSAWSGDLKNSCREFAHMGVWAFHGEHDPLIGVSSGRKPVDVLAGCSPPLTTAPKFTILDDTGHGNWQLVFENQHGADNTGGDGRSYDDVYRWLLSFSNQNPTDRNSTGP